MIRLNTLRWRLVLAAGLPLLAAACSADEVRFPTENGPTAAEPTYELERVPVRHEVRFGAGSHAVGETERVALHNFLLTTGPALDEMAEVTATGPGAAAKGQAVVEVLRRFGVQSALRVADGTAGDPVMVTFNRAVYVPGACVRADDWGSATDLTSAPLGCATAINLARMVEDPQDLVRPRATTAAEAAPQAAAMVRYRTGATTPLATLGGGQ